MVHSAPGRFEVAAVDGSAAHAVATMADAAWRHLERPLALPAAFSSPIMVRLLPAEPPSRSGADPFQVNVEAGGIVSLWWRGGDATPARVLRRALVRGLLSRLAVAMHGSAVPPTVPAWLEHACVAWWETRADAAQLDAAKQWAARRTPPAIAALLDWKGGSGGEAGLAESSLWLLTFLQAESTRTGEWREFVRRLLAGMDPQAALATCYPGRFFGVPARELWWQTGWHHARRVRNLPAMEASESRAALAALVRFVFATPDGETDFVAPLGIVMMRRSEPLVAAELARRVAELRHLIPALHPFYRNAGLSLAEVWAAGPAEQAKLAELGAAFERDWSDAVELEAATNAALDALERTKASAVTPESG